MVQSALSCVILVPMLLAQKTSDETYKIFAGAWVRTIPPGVDLLPRKSDSEQLLSALPQWASTRLPQFIALFAITVQTCGMCWLRDLVVRWGEIARNKMIITAIHVSSVYAFLFACKQKQQLICKAAFCKRAFWSMLACVNVSVGYWFLQQLLFPEFTCDGFRQRTLCMFD